jgi:uncharacterized protein
MPHAISLDDLHDLPVVDADAHLIEPADLWTSRVARKHRDFVPKVDVHPDTGHHHWRIGDSWAWPVGHFGQAGWREYPPFSPWEFDEIDPAGFDPKARLERMDEYGIAVQVLYPNLIGFKSPQFISLGPELSLLCTQVYNDFALEWASVDPRRLVPVAMLPFWDLEASITEMERTRASGHRGVLFANKFEQIGLPHFCDPHWDPIYSAAQSLDMPINYHIGFSSSVSEALSAEGVAASRADGDADQRPHALKVSTNFLGQASLLGDIVTSGLCDRFPTVKLVSVESGFGHVPFYLETLDWHWRAYGNSSELLPSEYYVRQCYGTFWFEKATLPMLALFPDNFMFSTDFPHGTSLSPGPASPSDVPSVHIGHAFGGLDGDIARKAIYQNAERLYKLDLPVPAPAAR